MYNEDRKLKFLTSMTASMTFGQSVFNTTQPSEEKYGRDLCLLTTDELQEIVNEKFGIRSRGVNATLGVIRSYFKWCAEQGYETSDGILGVKVQTEEKIKRLMVSSPKHLEMVLDKAFDDASEETTDCLYRCFFWMAFAGMTDVDAMDVKVDEVDFNSMLINHNGRSYELYREAIPAFRNACFLTEFAYAHPKYTKIIQRKRVPSEYLMRGIKAGKIRLLTIRSLTGKRFAERDIPISYNRIYLSGAFYRAYEMERAGFTPDFDDVVVEKVCKIDRAYSANYTREKAARAIKNDLINDYECWKRAFG